MKRSMQVFDQQILRKVAGTLKHNFPHCTVSVSCLSIFVCWAVIRRRRSARPPCWLLNKTIGDGSAVHLIVYTMETYTKFDSWPDRRNCKYLGDISWEAWSFLARLDPQLSGVCQAELDQLCKCLWTACNAPHLKKHSQCTPPRACLSSASELQQMCTLDTVHYALHKWDWSSFILALNFSVINIGKNMWFFWDKLRVFLGWV